MLDKIIHILLQLTWIFTVMPVLCAACGPYRTSAKPHIYYVWNFKIHFHVFTTCYLTGQFPSQNIHRLASAGGEAEAGHLFAWPFLLLLSLSRAVSAPGGWGAERNAHKLFMLPLGGGAVSGMVFLGQRNCGVDSSHAM